LPPNFFFYLVIVFFCNWVEEGQIKIRNIFKTITWVAKRQKKKKGGNPAFYRAQNKGMVDFALPTPPRAPKCYLATLRL